MGRSFPFPHPGFWAPEAMRFIFSGQDRNGSHIGPVEQRGTRRLGGQSKMRNQTPVWQKQNSSGSPQSSAATAQEPVRQSNNFIGKLGCSRRNGRHHKGNSSPFPGARHRFSSRPPGILWSGSSSSRRSPSDHNRSGDTANLPSCGSPPFYNPQRWLTTLASGDVPQKTADILSSATLIVL
jgi:hypothetical protein